MTKTEYFPFKEGFIEFDIHKYDVQNIDAKIVGDFPPSYQIEGIPWISYIKAYCEAATLQMIAYKYGIRESIDYFNFLMGFGYGHTYLRASMVIFPFTDPELGFDMASPYLSLKRKFFVTSKAEIFLKALRFYISKDIPIKLSLDWATLVNQNRFLPHSILVVGYEESGFYYYETTQKDRFIEGAKGLKVTDQSLVNGVSKLSRRFSYPWKYAFTIFEKYGKRKKNLVNLWQRNGELLLGKEYINKINKSFADIFMSEINENRFKDLHPIKWKLEFAIYSRADNSRFLREYFQDQDMNIKESVRLFMEASECYKKVLELIEVEGSQSEDIWDFLNNAESLEKKVGLIFTSIKK